MKTSLSSVPVFALTSVFVFAIAALAVESSKSSLSMKDEAFVKKVAQGGMTEVQLGKLAAQKATRTDVKGFGSMMVTDHSKANEELKALAASKNVTLEDKLDAKHAGNVDELAKLEGAQFDSAYVKDMVKDHKMDVAEFEKAGEATKDAELKAFIEKTLPVLKTHLNKIEGIAAAKAN